MVLKPSEQDPGAAMMLVELAKEAGVPDGCVNIIHGQHDAVNFICDHPDIKAISFVGSDQAVSSVFDVDAYLFTSRASTSTSEDVRTENVFRPTWVPKTMELFCRMLPRMRLSIRYSLVVIKGIQGFQLVAAGFGAAGQRKSLLISAVHRNVLRLYGPVHRCFCRRISQLDSRLD